MHRRTWTDVESRFAFYAPQSTAAELLPYFDAFCHRLEAIRLRAVEDRFYRALHHVATWVDWYQKEIAAVTDLTTFNHRWHTLLLSTVAPTWSAYPNIKILRNALTWVSAALHSGRYGDEPTCTPNPRKAFQAEVLCAVNACEPSLRAAWKLGLQRLAFEDTRLEEFFTNCKNATYHKDVEALRARLKTLPKKMSRVCDAWLDLYLDGGMRYRQLSDPMGDFMTPAERFWLDDLALRPIETCGESELHVIFNSHLLPGGTVEELLPYFFQAVERLRDGTPCTSDDAFSIIGAWLLYHYDELQMIADWKTLAQEWVSALLWHMEHTATDDLSLETLFQPIESYEDLPWYNARMTDFLQPLWERFPTLSTSTQTRIQTHLARNDDADPSYPTYLSHLPS